MLSMEEILVVAARRGGDQSNQDEFSAQQFKKERRVKSGAEIIIPGVLAFLEDEPVAKILAEFEKLGYITRPDTPLELAGNDV
jgi:hypothetical protein